MTPWIRPSPASVGSDTIVGSCSRPIMSLRGWTCDARWPSARGCRLCKGRPADELQSNGSVENAVGQLKG
eukprot:2953868-Alexandrium_andersonii.AAC.1